MSVACPATYVIVVTDLGVHLTTRETVHLLNLSTHSLNLVLHSVITLEEINNVIVVEP